MEAIFAVETDPGRFRQRVWPFFEQDPVGRTLAMTVLDAVVSGSYDRWVLASVQSASGEVTGCAVQTPPHNLIVAGDTVDDVGQLARGLRAEGITLPGVVGLTPGVHEFARVWCVDRAVSAVEDRASRLFRMDALASPRPAEGSPRVASPDDLDLIVAWTEAFLHEAGGIKPSTLPQMLVGRIASGRLRLWECGGRSVSFLGHSPALAGHARIGPVYTPPEHRGRGFASNLVAHVSAELLERGLTPTLFTDLANPTSNAIYQAIGYTSVADSFEITFVAPDPLAQP
jgi:GNAT superfamily N-acetyltransferase